MSNHSVFHNLANNDDRELQSNGFSHALRLNDQRLLKTQQQNFDLKLLMQCQAQNNNAIKPLDPRRLSKNPPMDHFYDFDEGSNQDQEQQEPNIQLHGDPTRRDSLSYDFHKVHPHRTTPSRGSNKQRNYIASPSPSSRTHLRSPQPDMVTLELLEDDLLQMTEQKEMLETQLVDACATISRLESITSKLDGDVKRAENQADESRKRLEQTKRSLANAHVQLQSSDLQRNVKDREKILRTAIERRAAIAESKVNQLIKEKNCIETQLDSEKKRVVELEHARRKSIGHVRKSQMSVEQLLKEMDSQRSLLDGTQQYSSKWRDDAIKNMDLCLQILWACESQIGEKKRLFINSCSTGSSKGGPQRSTTGAYDSTTT